MREHFLQNCAQVTGRTRRFWRNRLALCATRARRARSSRPPYGICNAPRAGLRPWVADDDY
jgi:hypothetical protein